MIWILVACVFLLAAGLAVATFAEDDSLYREIRDDVAIARARKALPHEGRRTEPPMPPVTPARPETTECVRWSTRCKPLEFGGCARPVQGKYCPDCGSYANYPGGGPR